MPYIGLAIWQVYIGSVLPTYKRNENEDDINRSGGRRINRRHIGHFFHAVGNSHNDVCVGNLVILLDHG